MRPFRFLTPPQGDFDGASLAAFARRAESLGYSELIVNDHLTDQLAPIPVLATAAAATERLRIGSYVFNAALRHPAVLAQDLATLDRLSGGRVGVGIGAGWNRAEHDAIGLPFPSPGPRIARLAEAITVLKACFGPDAFDFAGEYYTVTGYDAQPKPRQLPHPPFFVGGGSRRVLELAAREADAVGLSPRMIRNAAGELVPDPRSLTAAATEEKIGWIRAAAGARFDDLELNTFTVYGPVVITNDAKAAAVARADVMRQVSGVELSAAEVLDSPHVFIGTVKQLTEKFEELRERFGINSVVLDDPEYTGVLVQELAGR